MTGGARLALVVLPAAALLAACGAGPASSAGQLESWARSTGFAGALAQLRGDLQRVPAVTGEDAGQRRTVCDVLVTDALSDNEQLPTPDATLTALLARAYAAAAASGRTCFSGASPAVAETGARAALRLLVQAEARYDAVSSSLATS